MVFYYLPNVGQWLSYNDILRAQANSPATYAYPSGSLVNDNGTIYLISGAAKIPFTNYAAFKGLGYSLKNVVKGGLSNYTPVKSYAITTANMAHPWSSWLWYSGTIYYSHETGLIGVPSFDIFTKNGGNLKYIIKANKYDLAVLNASPNLPVLSYNDTRLYSQPLLTSVPQPPTTTTPFCADCVNATVGPAKYVLGPMANAIDNPFFVLPSTGGMLGYTANQASYVMSGADVPGLALTGQVAIDKGTKGNFDECGSWLASAYQDVNIIRAWYHAEQSCDYATGTTNKSVAYAESYDGGKTFVKPNYPLNQILTGTGTPTEGQQTGLGDFTVVKFNGYYYAYFINYSNPQQWAYGVARSKISDGGQPGTWLKYYNGDFTEKGLGGKASPLQNISGSSVYNLSNNTLVSVGGPLSNGGLYLSFSTDGVNWTKMSKPLLYFEDQNWNRSPSAKELYAYASLIPTNGQQPLGNSFYLYYMYLNPGQDFTQRYLISRTVTLNMVSGQPAP